MKVSLIAAMSENGIIGRNGRLPWHLAADLQHFKQITLGHAIVMGRRTWESIGRPLAGRRMIVVTRQSGYRAEGVEIAGSLDDALALARAAGDDEVFVIGGAEIYRLALPYADRLYLTLIHAKIDGDTVFPPIDWSTWQRTASERHRADAKNDFPLSFQVFERQSPRSPG
jgi:dihydrofolate reductase